MERHSITVQWMDITYWQLLAIFAICAACGLAALLRSEEDITSRSVASAILNNGLSGVAVAALIMHLKGSESFPLVLCLSIFSGLLSNAALDQLRQKIVDKWLPGDRDID